VISSDFTVAHRQLLLGFWNGLGGRTPLFIVDGMQHRVSTISIRMILHPMILKKDASAAIYGTRAANGLIIITTKRKGQKVSVEIGSLLVRET
jgi:TonB-dependent SusC/RagA subfamily outer membrane receptor